MFEPNIIAQAQFFHCSRGKGADETVNFGRNSCPPILAMKKLGVLLLVSSIEYFDHLLVKNYDGNGLEKVYFLVYPSLKVQIFIFVFLFEPNVIAQAQFFHYSRGKGDDKTVKFGRNSRPPILAMKKLGLLLLVSSFEYFDHLLVKNYAGNL